MNRAVARKGTSLAGAAVDANRSRRIGGGTANPLAVRSVPQGEASAMSASVKITAHSPWPVSFPGATGIEEGMQHRELNHHNRRSKLRNRDLTDARLSLSATGPARS
jgi:hypothetical protein